MVVNIISSCSMYEQDKYKLKKKLIFFFPFSQPSFLVKWRSLNKEALSLL